jgi:aryl carrier-like protein
VAGTEAGDREAELRARLTARLPEYMVPSALVRLESFPLLSNGKVDRRGLPAPDPERRPGGSEFVAPRSATEEVVAGIWAAVLGRPVVGVDDNFFDLGGNSLLMIQVIAQAREQGFHLTPLTLFRHPTVRSLAEHLSGEGQAPRYEGLRQRAQRQREALARARKAPRRT